MRSIEARPEGPEYELWRIDAEKARNSIIAEWKRERNAAVRPGRPADWKPKFNEKLYKRFREVFLFKTFNRKCAYCEVNHSDGYPIQVEHYRPKAAVTEDRVPIDHPGYFWLAYEWWNLVPSCAHCNTSHTDPTGQPHPGKKNEFPLLGIRVAEPSDNPDHWRDELQLERPKLLNPYFDRPEESIDFDTATGASFAKNDCPRGKATILICDLNRQSLCDKRLDLKSDVLRGMMSRLIAKEPIDSVLSWSSELSLWRIRMIQNELIGLCQKVGITGQPAAHFRS